MFERTYQWNSVSSALQKAFYLCFGFWQFHQVTFFFFKNLLLKIEDVYILLQIWSVCFTTALIYLGCAWYFARGILPFLEWTGASSLITEKKSPMVSSSWGGGLATERWSHNCVTACFTLCQKLEAKNKGSNVGQNTTKLKGPLTKMKNSDRRQPCQAVENFFRNWLIVKEHSYCNWHIYYCELHFLLVYSHTP